MGCLPQPSKYMIFIGYAKVKLAEIDEGRYAADWIQLLITINIFIII